MAKLNRLLTMVLVPVVALGIFFNAALGDSGSHGLKRAATRQWPKSMDVIVEPWATEQPMTSTQIHTALPLPIRPTYTGWELWIVKLQDRIGLGGMYSLLLLLAVFNCYMFWTRWVGPKIDTMLNPDMGARSAQPAAEPTTSSDKK